jgi:DNA-binding MurR/RpiR family transcriptional regulator
MTRDLQKKLKSRWDSFTASEQKIASHLLNNMAGIPFETAASIGKRVGVSAMTVGRFLRNLGYIGLHELKDELRSDEPLVQLYNNPQQAGDGVAASSTLRAEIRGLTAAHALARTEEWKAIVEQLVAADRIWVASFHHGRFLGLGFASLLQHVKPRTAFADGLDGAYADVLLDSAPDTCVVLIDFRRYSRHFRLLAEETAARGIPLVIITDVHCYWARQLTPNVLMLPVDADRPWHNFSAATSLLSHLIGAVIRALGDGMDRIGETIRLRQKFVGYVEAPAADRRKGAATVKAGTGKRKTDKPPARAKPRRRQPKA